MLDQPWERGCAKQSAVKGKFDDDHDDHDDHVNLSAVTSGPIDQTLRWTLDYRWIKRALETVERKRLIDGQNIEG